MNKKDIFKKLDVDLDNNTDYTFIVLDLREYSHKKGLFVGFKEKK